MLSKETLERYRNLTDSERAILVVRSIRENWPALFEGPPETVAKRLQLLRMQNDERNRNMLTAMARTRESES